MPENVNDTVLNSITDNLVDSFFDGAGSSANVITPEPKTETSIDEKVEGKKEEEKSNNLDNFGSGDTFKAEDLLGDMLETPTEPVIDLPNKKVEHQPNPKTPELDFNFVVEDGILAGFEDDTPIKTKEDLSKLITANKEYWMTEARTKAIEEERSTLPEEVKFVLEYAKKGGDDFKTIFKLLSQTEEVRSYDISKEIDQKSVIRDYYDALGWTDEEIEEEIITLHENKRLEATAKKFQPKVASLRAQELEQKKQEQDLIDEQRGKARRFFEDNVINTLKGGKIGDLKLSKDEQLDMYNALVKEQYQSFNGPTNRLGALLDRIQYVKPDYEHLMEVAMLLSNRDGFKKKIREQITTDVTAEQVKKIKTEQQQKKIGSAHSVEKDTKKLPKLGPNFINPF